MRRSAAAARRTFGETIFPHLTTAEWLKTAEQAFERDLSELSCCAG